MSLSLQQASSLQALLRATERAAQGKRKQPEVARFLMDAERECLRLHRALSLPPGHLQAYRPGPARTFVLCDPKRRHITVVPFRDRVVHHALCEVLGPYLERYAIFDSYACRVGKGQHAALQRAGRFARASTHQWAFKGDVSSYFASISHDRLMVQLRRRVPDPLLCDWLDRIVRAYPVRPGCGLPIGTLTSQHLANLYLGALDHFIKDQLGVRRYLRYMDDFVAFGERDAMKELRERTHDFLRDALGLILNPKASRVMPVRDGVPMLGMRVFAGVIRPRPERWRLFRRKQQAVEAALHAGTLTEEAAAAKLTSQYAHLLKFNTHRLRCSHLARLARASSGSGVGLGRLQPGEPWRFLEQRREEAARRQSRQERPRQPQPEPGVSSFDFSTRAEPSGLIPGTAWRPEALGLRTAARVPRC